MVREIQITHAKREIIEKKLLIALNDDNKAAIIVTIKELNIIIEALDKTKLDQDFLDDLLKFKEEVFK